MGKTRRYLLETFTKTYLVVFLPFLLIVSLIFLIQLSILSSKVNIGFAELGQLFGYMLPEIFFYTIPLSLIAAVANTFTRLSDDNELIALFSLGHSPGRLLRILLPTMTLFSALLVVLSLLLYPQMKQKLRHFKRQKIAEATLKIAPNKLSQSFGDFHVFVEGKAGKNAYENMVLFNSGEKGRYQLFIARRAKIDHDSRSVQLRLYEGTAETSTPKKIESVSYRELRMYQYPKTAAASMKTSWEYWAEAARSKKRRGKLLFLLFVSLSPLLGYSIAAALSFYNPRYQRGMAAWVILIVALSVYLPAAILQKSGSLALFFLFLGGLVAGGLWLIRQRILKRF